ncbi:MAG: hypothetical protein WDO73_15545 [Ignavibacteriota bacterium]
MVRCPRPPPELVGDASESCSVWAAVSSHRESCSDHLDARLALPVNAVFQTEGAELIFGNVACEEHLGSFTEGLNFLANRTIMFNFKLLPGRKVSGMVACIIALF